MSLICVNLSSSYLFLVTLKCGVCFPASPFYGFYCLHLDCAFQFCSNWACSLQTAHILEPRPCSKQLTDSLAPSPQHACEQSMIISCEIWYVDFGQAKCSTFVFLDNLFLLLLEKVNNFSRIVSSTWTLNMHTFFAVIVDFMASGSTLVSLEFSIDIIFLATLWPCGWVTLKQKWIPGIFPGG
jgi:hypothetical protein